jgi:hypothetical protein
MHQSSQATKGWQHCCLAWQQQQDLDNLDRCGSMLLLLLLLLLAFLRLYEGNTRDHGMGLNNKVG